MKDSLVIVLLLVLAAPSVYAQATPISAVDEEAAKAHYQRGRDLIAQREYRRALAEFSAGYELSNRPAFLFNMAECARLSGDTPKARTLYQRYLVEVPKGPLSSQAKERLDELATEQPTALPSFRESEPAHSPSSDLTAATVVETDPGRTKRVVGIALGGTSVALLGIAGYFAIQSSDATDEINRFFATGGEWNDDLIALEARGKRDSKLAIGFAAAGAATFVTGGVFYYLGWSDGPPKKQIVSALPLNDGALVLWSGGF